ncbi:hypothetical protein [Deinococcus hopiensis]|uniref:Uncharacterized protein n=1 Tax=Deinococcus hopiensis KR-140 TaxID=695939 RepID=A0A1W1VMP3_9DEIO|nr:hypothetical protein [Deinococcus hopiensis]SMB94655.1 hypothetical protein SAMN00790413_02473 [Deinococcus hopiensis KR-140]
MTEHDSQTLQEAFKALRQEQAAAKGRFQSRAEVQQQRKNREVLNHAAGYTVDRIVRESADVQLEVGSVLAQLEERLSGQATKLSELVTATEVARRELAELRRIRVAADALAALQQESRDRLAALEGEHQARLDALEREQADTRRTWEREDAGFAAEESRGREETARERQQEEADHTYRRQRERQHDADAQHAADRAQERELAERRLTLERGWREREAALQATAEQFEKDLASVEAFPQELEEAVKKAREEGVRQATADAKVRSDLLEREWEASKQGHELHLESLQASIAAAEAQVAELQAQQQRVSEQTQGLAARAFSTASRSES